MSWTRRFLAPTLISLLIGLLAIELMARLLSGLGLLPVSDTPKVYLPAALRVELETEWRTERDSWGAWHQPQTRGMGVKPCFRVEYRTNSIGARDDEFPVAAPEPRILLIGDSFAEGVGVSKAESVADLVERGMQRPVLNFGAGGDLGPLQYRLLHQELARQFEHQTLLVLFLPDNDFTDNDYGFWKATGGNLIGDGTDAERWRPYYRETAEGGFEAQYPSLARRRDSWTTHTADPFEWKRWAYEHLWAYNVLRSVKLILLSRRIADARNGATYSGYFDASEVQQRAATYFLKRLVVESTAREIMLVAIPRPGDLERIRAGADANAQPWKRALQELGSSIPGKRYAFVDLADEAPADVSKFFNACDGHWTAAGNAWAGAAIVDRLKGLTRPEADAPPARESQGTSIPD